MTARVASVNVGRPRPVDTGRRVVETAIWKRPVAGRVAVRGVNVDGDDQADRTVHGGPDKAVYAYALEEIRQWEDELGRPLGAAAFGENLTTEGIDVSGALVGERWRIGTTLLEVVQPRLPCFKLGLRMGDPTFVKRFARVVAARRVPADRRRRASSAPATRSRSTWPRCRTTASRCGCCPTRSCSTTR